MQLRLQRQFGRKPQGSGFTLIELLVVIAIIGILAAVVLVSLNNARIRGRDARRLSDLQAIALAMELFADTEDGQYPDNLIGPCATNTSDPTPTAAIFNAIGGCLELANLIPDTPDDPLGGRDYFGNVSGDQDSYVLAGDLEQDNQACDADYDGTGGGFFAGCDEDVPADGCGGATETDDMDYCICQGPDC